MTKKYSKLLMLSDTKCAQKYFLLNIMIKFLIQSALDHDGIAGWITGKTIQVKSTKNK